MTIASVAISFAASVAALTLYDMVGRVVLPQRPLSTPIAEVMSHPVTFVKSVVALGLVVSLGRRLRAANERLARQRGSRLGDDGLGREQPAAQFEAAGVQRQDRQASHELCALLSPKIREVYPKARCGKSKQYDNNKTDYCFVWM